MPEAFLSDENLVATRKAITQTLVKIEIVLEKYITNLNKLHFSWWLDLSVE